MRTTHPHNPNHHHHHHHHHHSQRKSIPSLFSCAFFKHCTQSPLSPTTPHSPPPSIPLSSPQLSHHILSPTPPLPPPPPPLPPQSSFNHHSSKPCDSESSSSSTSQSFTQWRFSPTFQNPPPDHSLPPPRHLSPPRKHGSCPFSDLMELFHMAELRFASGSDSDRSSALHMLEQSLVPNPPSDAIPESGASVEVPAVVVDEVVQLMSKAVLSKSATKVLLALCLAEGNRRVAVECGAPSRVVDALPDLNGVVAERALAALELMITVPEGAAQVRAHALAVPMLVATMGRMEGRGREYTISVLAAVYGGCAEDHQLWEAAPPEEVARAVVLAMQQGNCSARGKRKGAQLLKILEQNGKVDLTQ